jgi:hypothetical protein
LKGALIKLDKCKPTGVLFKKPSHVWVYEENVFPDTHPSNPYFTGDVRKCNNCPEFQLKEVFQHFENRPMTWSVNWVSVSLKKLEELCAGNLDKFRLVVDSKGLKI